MVKNINLYHGDCRDVLIDLNNDGVKVDLILTSPPYDELRNYDNSLEWNFEVFKEISEKCYDILIVGGVMVWVVNDKTKNGSKTGTSFKQALFMKDLGFNLHDVMIFAKNNPIPQIFHNRYQDAFEYMFVLSKGKPKTCNPIMEPCKNKGLKTPPVKQINQDDEVIRKDKDIKIKDYKVKGNIWYYTVGCRNNYGHPAVFPKQLAIDHIKSWTNPSDIVLDPFMGSGTTGVACRELNRKFIGIEKVEKYYHISEDRIKAPAQTTLI